ncbi:uncharacterized protein [Henckelia pumila]|uniref:uncharacterized protein isoform X2 n=1 Tax=Henckelia pumila TaxID=405737 RepID=UPI003C6E2E70
MRPSCRSITGNRTNRFLQCSSDFTVRISECLFGACMVLAKLLHLILCVKLSALCLHVFRSLLELLQKEGEGQGDQYFPEAGKIGTNPSLLLNKAFKCFNDKHGYS